MKRCKCPQIIWLAYLIRFKNYTFHVGLLTKMIICINISDNFDHRIIIEDGVIRSFLLHGPSGVPLRQMMLCNVKHSQRLGPCLDEAKCHLDMALVHTYHKVEPALQFNKVYYELSRLCMNFHLKRWWLIWQRTEQSIHLFLSVMDKQQLWLSLTVSLVQRTK